MRRSSLRVYPDPIRPPRRPPSDQWSSVEAAARPGTRPFGSLRTGTRRCGYAGQQPDVRLRETHDVQSFPVDPFQDLVATTPGPGGGPLAVQFATVMETVSQGSLILYASGVAVLIIGYGHGRVYVQHLTGRPHDDPRDVLGVVPGWAPASDACAAGHAAWASSVPQS